MQLAWREKLELEMHHKLSTVPQHAGVSLSEQKKQPYRAHRHWQDSYSHFVRTKVRNARPPLPPRRVPAGGAQRRGISVGGGNTGSSKLRSLKMYLSSTRNTSAQKCSGDVVSADVGC